MGRVHLNHQGLCRYCIGIPIQILVSTDVKTSRTSMLWIIIHLSTIHLNDLAYAVVNRTRVDVHEVTTHTLEGNEITICCDRCVELLKELEQTFTRTIRWVHHQVLKEPAPRCSIEAIVQHIQQLGCQCVVNFFTLIVHSTMLDHYLGTLDRLTDVLFTIRQTQDHLDGMFR